MNFILGLLIGLVVGAGLVYALLQSRLDRQQRQVKQAQRALEEQARDHEVRLQTMMRSLKEDHQTQHAQELEALRQDYESKLIALTTQANASQEADPIPLVAAPFGEGESTSSLSLDEPQNVPVVTSPIARTAPTPQTAEQLIESLSSVAQSAQMASVIGYANHPDSRVRKLVATTVGQLVGANSHRVAGLDLIGVLRKLSRDSDPSVRQSAVTALGLIPSAKVIPILKLALRDSNLDVVRSANEAIARFKYYRNTSSSPLKKSQSKLPKR